MIFLPRNDYNSQEKCKTLIETELLSKNYYIYRWRQVPINTAALGIKAENNRPEITQVIFKSNNKNLNNNTRYIKMNGRKVYEFALTTVPNAIKMCIEEAGVKISDVKKILLHQANAKMDTAMGRRLYNCLLYTSPSPRDRSLPRMPSSA